ncbi:MAG: efflux RND transporter periplasmic adaptor subunit [Desulfobacterales bacterium]|nr:efflux RND transporter periplasmic adaptor subunit [Desulfobacterales bacterium]
MNKNFSLPTSHFSLLIICLALFSSSASAAEEAYPVIFEAVSKAVLSAETPGVLKSLKYDVGAWVKKGEVIARMDLGDLDLRKKRSSLALKHLNIKMKNLQRLSQKGLATNEEVAQTQMEKDVTYTDIQIFKRLISKSYIRAPFSCVIVRRHMHAHEWVTAGQPVVDIVNPGKLRAIGNIPSRLAVELKKGATHSFFIHDLNITVGGTVKAIVPMVDELSNTAQVVWSIGKPDKKLLSGMKGEVRITY